MAADPQRHVGGGFGYAVENILTDRRRVAGGLGRELKRGHAFADRRELGQGGRIEYRIGVTIMSPERVRTTV